LLALGWSLALTEVCEMLDSGSRGAEAELVVPERGGTPLRQIFWSRNGAPVNVVGHRRNANTVAFRQIRIYRTLFSQH